MHQSHGLIPEVYELALRTRTNRGKSLLDLSRTESVLLVFLRYLGCPFCRETLRDLSNQRAALEASGCQIVLIYMDKEEPSEHFFAKYGLEDVPRIRDAKRTLYRAFGLQRGSVWNLIGPATWWRGFQAIVLEAHGFGWARSDLFQMPGTFLVRQGRVINGYMHKRSSDRPDYLHLAATAEAA